MKMKISKVGVAKTFSAAFLIAALTLDFSGFSEAQTNVPSSYILTWTPALTFTDGVPFDETAIEKYDLYCDGAHIVSLSNDFTRSHTVTVDTLGVGDHTCTLSETVGGLESVASNAVSFSLGQRTPNAPTLAASPGA